MTLLGISSHFEFVSFHEDVDVGSRRRGSLLTPKSPRYPIPMGNSLIRKVKILSPGLKESEHSVCHPQSPDLGHVDWYSTSGPSQVDVRVRTCSLDP